METKVKIPFHQILTAVRTLTPDQKERIRKELTNEERVTDDKSAFINMLMNGPVFTEEEIMRIEENRKSISKWRTKN